jgi:hypothetical protein
MKTTTTKKTPAKNPTVPPASKSDWGAAVQSNKLALDGLGIDGLCRRLKAGETLTAIAADIGLKSTATLLDWIASDPDRSARAREARIAASVMYDEQAQKAILDAADSFELAKAKELAHHLRWRASKIDPRNYGDKTESVNIEVGPEIAKITTPEQRLRAAREFLAANEIVMPIKQKRGRGGAIGNSAVSTVRAREGLTND